MMSEIVRQVISCPHCGLKAFDPIVIEQHACPGKNGGPYRTAADFKIEQPPDPWARLPALAARLGVKPVEPGGPPRVMIRTVAGQQYDVFEIANALLDVIERVTERERQS